MDEVVQIVRTSIEELASMCDYASSKDGAGFDKTDSGFGHSVIKQAKWSKKQIRHSAKLVIKYQGQLGGVDIEKINELISVLDQEIEQEEQKKKTDMKVLLLTGTDGAKKLAIITPYDKATIETIKTFEGRRWNQEQMRWEIPMMNLEKVKSTFPNAEYSEGLKQLEDNIIQRDRFISEEYKKISSEIDLTKPLPDGKTLFTHQKTGVMRMVKYRRQILADDMGLGKCEYYGNRVFTPHGRKALKDLLVGDEVIGRDGFPCPVTGIFPQGKVALYRVTFNDGMSVLVGAEHLWTVISGNEHREIVLSTEQLLDKDLYVKLNGKGWNEKKSYKIKTYYKDEKNGNNRWQIPIVKPIYFDHQRLILPVDPYLLGVLIGDGCLIKGIQLDVHKKDFVELLSGVKYKEIKTAENKRKASLIYLKKDLIDLGLMGKNSSNKFIPDIYKYSSIPNRIALLQGLMDTDGYVSKHKKNEYHSSTEYCTVSFQLAQDVADLVNALGGIARMSSKIGSYTKNNKRIFCQRAYRLNIKMPEGINPFRLKRKSLKYSCPKKYKVARYIKDIKYEKEDYAICISVNSRDQLYVTEHCIVTHNTLQCLVAAKILSEYYGWNIIIISPVSLIEKPWIRDAMALKISKQRFAVFSWAKIPVPPPVNYILIADEAHYAQAGTKTIRGKAFLALSTNDNCMACFPATGTPIKNGRPINIFPLLEAIRHELARDIRYFQLRYCNAHLQKFGKGKKFWDVNGSSNLSELNAKIKDAMIRRTKKDCLDLPEKLRVLREAELSSESIKLYEDTLKRLRHTYQERLESGEIKEGGEALVLLGQLAHAGALGKVESAYEIAEEVIEEGNQVVIFSTYVEPLNTLKEKFETAGIPAELLIGDTKDRGSLVDRFLAGKSKVFLLSMAGGVGIDLYTATTIILINRAWTPGDVLQIEDRLHRIGQKNPVTSIWLQYGEVDAHVDAILESKSINISEVLTSKNKESEVITFAKKYLKAKR